MKKTQKTRNYFIKVINQNKLICNQHKKVCTTLYYIEHFFISVPAFSSLFVISMVITSSAVALKSHAIAPGMKNYKSIIEKIEGTR